MIEKENKTSDDSWTNEMTFYAFAKPLDNGARYVIFNSQNGLGHNITGEPYGSEDIVLTFYTYDSDDLAQLASTNAVKYHVYSNGGLHIVLESNADSLTLDDSYSLLLEFYAFEQSGIMFFCYFYIFILKQNKKNRCVFRKYYH